MARRRRSRHNPRGAGSTAPKHRIVTDAPWPAKSRRTRTSSSGTRAVNHPLQQAEFVLSIANDAQLPPPGPPEIAFAGRSNAGKSTAINVLANRTRLAFASKTPGRTQQINFFRLRSGALLADLPGYGYAAVPLELKRHWQGFLGRYVATRQSLVGARADRRRATRPRGPGRRATREASSEAGGRCCCSRPRWTSSPHRSSATRSRPSAKRSPPRFPRTPRRSQSCRSRRRGASALTAAEAVLARVARAGTIPRARRGFAGAQRKGPAIKGSVAGPETPARG